MGVPPKIDVWGVATLSSYVLKMEGGQFSPHPDNPKSLDWANEGMIMTVKMVLGSAMKAQSMGIGMKGLKYWIDLNPKRRRRKKLAMESILDFLIGSTQIRFWLGFGSVSFVSNNRNMQKGYIL